MNHDKTNIVAAIHWANCQTYDKGQQHVSSAIGPSQLPLSIFSYNQAEPAIAANLTTYTILSLFSLQVEPAPHLLSP